MNLPFALVDAFTLGRGFTGNPAAVVVLPPSAVSTDAAHMTLPPALVPANLTAQNSADVTTKLFQTIAAEMNQSETVFVQQHHQTNGDGDDRSSSCFSFSIRWFTPTHEVPLCGHATLAATHALFSSKNLVQRKNNQQNISSGKSDEFVDFRTKDGRVFRVRVLHKDSRYTLRFPNNKPDEVNFNDASCYSSKVAAAVRETCKVSSSSSSSAVPNIKKVFYNTPTKKYIVQLDAPESVANLQVDIGRLHAALSASRVASVTFTAPTATSNAALSSPLKQDWESVGAVAVSRHFAPWVGIPEDSVTGAAHTVMVPMYAATLFPELAEQQLKTLPFFQAMPGRGGVLWAGLSEDGGKAVMLTGRGSTIVSGTLRLTQEDVSAKMVASSKL